MPQCIEYLRPSTLESALAFLSRSAPITRPLAGGTHYGRGAPPCEALLDLCDLNLGGVRRADRLWQLGATTTLAELGQAEGLLPALRRAAQRQAPRNIDRRATLGGAVAMAESGPLLTGLLALQARLHFEPGGQSVGLAEFLAGRSETQREHALIVSVSFDGHRRMGLAEVARTPADSPLLCVAVAATPAGPTLSQVTVAAGATGQPLAIYPEAARWLEARPVTENAGTIPPNVFETITWKTDVRGSAEYGQALLPELVHRAWTELLTVSGEASHEG
jgi:CO/xanthine dehydrogenase FAD-binding subunit